MSRVTSQSGRSSNAIPSVSSTSTARQGFAQQTTRGDIAEVQTVEGKLYLFVNASIFAEYKKDKENILKEADKMWAGIRSTAVEELR